MKKTKRKSGERKSIDAIGDDGFTLLIRVLKDIGTRIDAVRAVPDEGADPDAAEKTGVRPIEYAVRDSGENIVLLLLKCGADPNLPDQSATPLLVYAMKSGKNGRLRYLIRFSARVHGKTYEKILSYCLLVGHKLLESEIQELFRLLSAGRLPPWTMPKEECGRTDVTNVSAACSRGDVSVVTDLLKAELKKGTEGKAHRPGRGGG